MLTERSQNVRLHLYKDPNKKIYSVLLEVRIVETSAWKGAQKTFQGDFLFHSLGSGHMGMFSLWKFFKLYTYTLYGFLYVSCDNRKLKATNILY